MHINLPPKHKLTSTTPFDSMSFLEPSYLQRFFYIGLIQFVITFMIFAGNTTATLQSLHFKLYFGAS